MAKKKKKNKKKDKKKKKNKKKYILIMSVKYQIEVPDKQIAKDVNNKTHDLSIEPKYNRKIIWQLKIYQKNHL